MSNLPLWGPLWLFKHSLYSMLNISQSKNGTKNILIPYEHLYKFKNDMLFIISTKHVYNSAFFKLLKSIITFRSHCQVKIFLLLPEGLQLLNAFNCEHNIGRRPYTILSEQSDTQYWLTLITFETMMNI